MYEEGANPPVIEESKPESGEGEIPWLQVSSHCEPMVSTSSCAAQAKRSKVLAEVLPEELFTVETEVFVPCSVQKVRPSLSWSC